MEEPVKLCDYITKIESHILDSDQIPLWGEPPEFPWDLLEKQLAASLHLNQCLISNKPWQWSPFHDIYEGLGEKSHVIKIAVTPLKEGVYLVMSSSDIALLANKVILGSSDAKSLECDDSLQQGFYHFFTVELLHLLSSFGYPRDLSLRISENNDIPECNMLFSDVQLNLDGINVWGRLLVPESFRGQWSDYYAPKKPYSISAELARKIELSLNVEVGETSLSLEECQNLHEGDCIILDSCSMNLDKLDSTAVLSMAGKSYLRARIIPEGLEILEEGIFNFDGAEEVDPPQENTEVPSAEHQDYDEDGYDDDDDFDDLFEDDED